MGTEIAFAKSFLAQLDAKPSKIGPDHVEDARNYPGGNAFLLPRYPSSPPLPKRRSGARSAPSNTASASASPSDTVQVHATSARNPPLSLRFPNLPLPTTSLLDVKQLVSNETGIPLAKIKLLFNKKPVGDTKVLKDLYGGQGGGEVEIGLMVIGGAASLPPKQEREKKEEEEEGPQQPVDVDKGEEAKGRAVKEGGGGEEMQADDAPVVVAPGVVSGKEVMKTDEFWEDLRGFLEQRVKDEKVAREVVEQWKGNWTA